MGQADVPPRLEPRAQAAAGPSVVELALRARSRQPRAPGAILEAIDARRAA